MTSEPLHVRATFLPNKRGDGGAYASISVEIAQRLSGVVATPSEIHAAVAALRLAGVEESHILVRSCMDMRV